MAKNRYFTGAEGPYIYCEICGQPCYLRETVKLSPFTGRGGLVVCKDDADRIDPGLIPYMLTEEKKVPFSRPNHTNITNSSAPIDAETSTDLGV